MSHGYKDKIYFISAFRALYDVAFTTTTFSSCILKQNKIEDFFPARHATNLGPIGSAVFTFIEPKTTNIQVKYIM